MLDESTLTKLHAFALSMRMHAQGAAGGTRRTRSLGSSLEFSDFRRYAPGDDLRRIDWNAYARFDKLFLKLFFDEQETTLRILLDASASMQGGLDGDIKWKVACQLSAALAYLSLCRYDRVTIVALHAGNITQSRVFSGRQSYPAVEAFLSSIEPSGETALLEALARVKTGAGRGVCALISDLLTDSDWQRGIKSLLYRRQEVCLLHLLSPEEMSPDFTEPSQLLDAEGAPPLSIQPTPDAMSRYHDTLSAFLLLAEKFARERAFPYALLRSDMAFETDMLRSLVASGIISPVSM